MAQTKDGKGKGRREPSGARAIVAPDPLGQLKRRAEDLGLIVHARAKPAAKRAAGKRGK
ncbi:MAG TPA: hypothetical protein VF546_10145 [Pyrinomonadaceae bacterium]